MRRRASSRDANKLRSLYPAPRPSAAPAPRARSHGPSGPHPRRAPPHRTDPTRFTEGIFLDEALGRGFEEIEWAREVEDAMWAARLTLRD